MLSTNTGHNKLLSDMIYCTATGSCVCVLQHGGLWHVRRPDVGVMLDVRTFASVVCNPEKVILLGRCTDFLRAQTHLGKKANCSHSQNASLEQYFVIENISFIM